MVHGSRRHARGSKLFRKDVKNTVRHVQKDFLCEYENNIGSYTHYDQEDKVKRYFDFIVVHLSKDNKVYVYSNVNSNLRYDVGYKYFGYALN